MVLQDGCWQLCVCSCIQALFLCCWTRPSIRQHLCCDDCLEDNGADYQNCSVVYYLLQLWTVISTVMWAVCTSELGPLDPLFVLFLFTVGELLFSCLWSVPAQLIVRKDSSPKWSGYVRCRTLTLLQGDHFPEHTKFPDFSSGAGKDSSIYCLPLWSTVVASR